jgi:hypothetical protein
MDLKKKKFIKEMDKKKIFYKTLFFFLIVIVLFYFFKYSPSSKINLNSNAIINQEIIERYSVSEDIPFLYNISVNNTETDPLSNISQVNISYPLEFRFIINTNGTNSLEQDVMFENNSNTLSWTKENLIPNSSKVNFWFNLTANKTGQYNLTVSFLNSTGSYSENVSVSVNDTTKPLILFNSNSDTNNSAYSRNYIRYNISAYDKNNISSIYIYLYNSSMSLINSTNVKDANNISGNFSNLNQGTYFLNVSVNDTYNNKNNTGLLKIILHTTPPIVTLISPSNNANITSSPGNFSFNVTSGIEIANCKLIIDGHVEKTESNIDVNSTNLIRQLIDNGTQEWNINCTDLAGNVGNSSKRIFNAFLEISNTVHSNTPSTTNTNNSSQNNSSVNTTGTSNISKNYTEIQVSSSELQKIYNNTVKEKIEIKFNVSNSSHSLKIEEIFNNSIRIILQSTPQEANITVGEEKKFDVSNDSFYDLSVKLNSINNNGANLSIKEIHEKVMNTSSNSSDNSTFLIITIIVLVLILIIVGVFLFLNFRKKKENNQEDEDYDEDKDLPNNQNGAFINPQIRNPIPMNQPIINPQPNRFVNPLNPDLEKLKELAKG